MSIESYNPNDPLFLASESIDGPLPPEMERALHDNINTSDELRVEAAQLKRVDKIITRFAARQPVLNWEAHAEKILARIAQQCSDESLDEVDQALTAWSTQDAVDETPDMATAVLERARADRNQIFRLPWLARVTIPLAAAAAIVFAIVPSIWNQSKTTPVCVVQISSQNDTATDIDGITRRSDVRFVRVARVTYEPGPTHEIGLLSVGAG